MIPQAGKAVFLAAISALLQSRKLSMHTASNPMQTESRAHEELRLLYQVSTSDISYFKTQQWSVTNYTLLVLAALVAAAQILKPSPSCTDRCLLTVLAGVAAIGAAGLLFNLELSIRKRRDRLQKIRAQFSAAFNQAWGTKGHDIVTWVLIVTVLVAAAVACWLIYGILP